MLDVLQFIFGSFWRWLGTMMLVVAIGASITPLITIKHVRGDDDA